MERLKERYNSMILAKDAFNRTYDLYKRKFNQAELAEREAYLASIIKHFEILYEMVWKFVKAHLSEAYGIQTVGSKSIFRACYEKKIIDDHTLEELLEIVEIRNVTVHVYSEETAKKVSDSILKHYNSIEVLLKSLENTHENKK